MTSTIPWNWLDQLLKEYDEGWNRKIDPSLQVTRYVFNKRIKRSKLNVGRDGMGGVDGRSEEVTSITTVGGAVTKSLCLIVDNTVPAISAWKEENRDMNRYWYWPTSHKRPFGLAE